MAAPIALQLYSVREAMNADFAGTIRKVAGMGYVGVETAGFPEEKTTAECVRVIRDNGLEICGAHRPLPLGEQKNAVLDWMATLGAKYLVCPWLDPKVYFQDEDGVKRACDLLNEANTVAREHKLVLGYHNHAFEYKPLPNGGKRPYELMFEQLDPSIIIEVDTYWVKVGGVDPVGLVQRLGARSPLLHIKDGPATQDDPMVALGDGVMDIRGIINAGKAEWLVVELDQCATDMLEAVAKSSRYLTQEGLARGKQ